jgi:uncharacterized protein
MQPSRIPREVSQGVPRARSTVEESDAVVTAELAPIRHPYRSATMTIDVASMPAPVTHDEAGRLFGQRMGLVAGTAGAFALGTYATRDLATGWNWFFFAASFSALLIMNRTARRPDRGQATIGLLLLLGFVLGAAVSPTLVQYARTDPGVLWNAGVATGLFVAGFGAAGYSTNRHLSALARTLWWGLVALIAFGIVTILVQVSGSTVLYDVLALVIFAGLTAFDFQRLRRSRDLRSAPLLAAAIFLEAVNVFLLFTSLGGRNVE